MLLAEKFTTKPALIERMAAAAKAGVSAHDIHQQKVSFILSSVKDEDSSITREMVERELRRHSVSP